MFKRDLLVSSIFLLITFLSSACGAGLKTAAKEDFGTATRTPFLAKATFTATNTPALISGDRESGECSQTPILDAGEADDSILPGSLTITPTTIIPSLSPSGTAGFSQTPTFTTALTEKPVQTSTQVPQQPSATASPANPSDTLESATLTPTPIPSSSTPLPTETTAPSGTPVPTLTPIPAGCSPTGNAAYENEVVNLINQIRKDRGLPALTQNASLRASARRHSEDMACNDFFSHTGSDGSTLASRLLDAGYSFSWAAENIAASSSSGFSAQSVVSMWMGSSGHKKNLLNENARQIGVGFRYAGDSNSTDFDAYYTADFGRP